MFTFVGGMLIEIDASSGFCFGVTRAIGMAERELAASGRLCCLGDIVHNEREVARLSAQGLQTIDHTHYACLKDATVLLRAHGEPPATYETARKNNLRLIDATCPVVLKLQERIRREFLEGNSQIVIFGKKGHAEVLGLVAQTAGAAMVISKAEDLNGLDYSRSIVLYSQTTSPLAEYRRIVQHISRCIQPPATFRWFDTICRRVSSRAKQIGEFASRHDAVLFVSGTHSSNGRALFNECLRANPRSYLIEGPEQICTEWLEGVNSLGISGATSTPRWLMEQCRDAVDSRN